MEATYVPLRRGFMYLVAALDWHSRYVLSWELMMVATRFWFNSFEFGGMAEASLGHLCLRRGIFSLLSRALEPTHKPAAPQFSDSTFL